MPTPIVRVRGEILTSALQYFDESNSAIKCIFYGRLFQNAYHSDAIANVERALPCRRAFFDLAHLYVEVLVRKLLHNCLFVMLTAVSAQQTANLNDASLAVDRQYETYTFPRICCHFWYVRGFALNA